MEKNLILKILDSHRLQNFDACLVYTDKSNNDEKSEEKLGVLASWRLKTNAVILAKVGISGLDF